MHIPALIADLALMLLTAGVISIIFKKLKLPLILGYILAGFLISPYFPMFFGVEDLGSIEIWSEIGVIVILFHIGLEFNLHKLVELGSTAVITAIIKMSGVMMVGYAFGTLIGLSTMNCVFLGVMLSISSTAVIQKSFDELELGGEKHTGLVIGTLIVEDVVSVFLMVILSTISVSQSIGGQELILNLLLMMCYLIIWLILGIYLLPTFLNKVIKLMTDEMLTVLSLGFCFGMAIIAQKLGFSVELGAFLAGSLLAGTVHVDRVEHVTTGFKDIFGSIFFLSVGIMVDPQTIAIHWKSIIPIAIIAIVAKLVFATIGMILSGQSLDTAVKSGFSLAPIGEFSFIIASLGISLGVMDEYLYPVIVSAAVLTIFITPVLMKNAGRTAEFLEKHLPAKLIVTLRRYTSSSQADDEKNSDWEKHMRLFFSRLIIYGVIMLGAAITGCKFVAPFLMSIMPDTTAKIITCCLIYATIAVFVRPLLNFHSKTFTALWLAHRSNRLPLIMLTTIKIVVITAIAVIPIQVLFGVHQIILLVAIVFAIIIAGKSNFMATSYLQMETKFLRNLNERTIEQEEKARGKQEWLDDDISIISFFVPENASYVGKHLAQLHWGQRHDVFIVKIRRGEKHFLLPSGKMVIHAGDKLYAVGELKSLQNFYKIIGLEPGRPIRTLDEFMASDYPDAVHALSCCAIKIHGDEPFAGQPIRNSNMMNKWHCMILGIQKDGYPLITPDANIMINKGDILWVMGSNSNVGLLAATCIFNDYEEREG